MIIFPAIDLFEGKAVRLFKGDYNQMTVYNTDPGSVADDFVEAGAEAVHLVDLEGARSGSTPNFATVCSIKDRGLFCEIGGGVRDMKTVEKYLSSGLDRVILGTAAISGPVFLEKAAAEYGSQIAVGADIRDGRIAVSGWMETTDVTVDQFFERMQDLGISTIICTDISKDGAMHGTNRELYRTLSQKYRMQITASGGVSSLDDIRTLSSMHLYAAIIGKAYYEGAIDLRAAIELAGKVSA
ncbi:MAG TPA: 1-(5-phosphoribosyl)-5-[(5-phosphoribosylamino)methylideneamino]imidazole-4-carboxamide isomerase [Methanocorpusculum sp.]|nr:1-(5-phosphoribosyl)-5-[(5-phosphoribosylamino)methylideneamino]imidazole-4-carboxamide isomerase [Methanocorpusculum sp.]